MHRPKPLHRRPCFFFHGEPGDDRPRNRLCCCCTLGPLSFPPDSQNDTDRIDSLGKTFLSHLCQSRNDWPSEIGPVGTMLRPLEEAWSMVLPLRHAKHKSTPPPLARATSSGTPTPRTRLW
ncbi:unnamed protein product [Ectocarpus sp. 12 AP-2014]